MYRFIKRAFKTIANNNNNSPILPIPPFLYTDPLAPYMAGLYEADGNLGILENPNGVKSIRLSISFNKDDLPFAKHLQSLFNMGSIHMRKEHAVDWTIYAQEDVLNMLIFINGHFRTVKIIDLRKIFEIYKDKYDINIPCLPLNNSPILDNSWFAGFTDADSSFMIECSNKRDIVIAPFYYLEVTNYYIKKEQEYDEYRDNTFFMGPIAETFNAKLRKRTRPPRPEEGFKETKSLYLRLQKKEQLNQLIDYFTKFTLGSLKYLNFFDVMTAYKIKHTLGPPRVYLR